MQLLLLALLFFAGPGIGQSVYWSLEFAKVNNHSLRLDLYLPPDYHGMPRPLLILIHGGGWNSGDKAQAILSGECSAMDIPKESFPLV